MSVGVLTAPCGGCPQLTYPYAAACISQLVPLAVLVMLLWGSVQTVVEPKGAPGIGPTQS